MDWKFSNFIISKWIVFVLVMAIVIIVVGTTAYQKDSVTFWPAILAGLCSGLVTLLADKFIDRQEIKFLTTRDFIETILDRRDNQPYYQKMITASRRQIDFLGKTGERLLNDFADLNARDDGKTSLLKAMDRGVRVRFLLAHEDVLGPDASKVKNVKSMISAIKQRYPQAYFEVLYYNFPPAFSFFRADDHIVFGANLPTPSEDSALAFTSRPTPSVVAGALSVVSKSYIEFFERTWTGIGDGTTP